MAGCGQKAETGKTENTDTVAESTHDDTAEESKSTEGNTESETNTELVPLNYALT